MDSGFDVLPLGDLVDLAAVAADDALIEALGRSDARRRASRR